MQQEDIIIMCSVTNKLRNNEIDKNKDYLNICNLIDDYKKKYCNHVYETDYIDISPEKSIQIEYCINCELDKKFIEYK